MATILLLAEARLQNTANCDAPPPPYEFQPTRLQPISLVNMSASASVHFHPSEFVGAYGSSDAPTRKKVDATVNWLAVNSPTPKDAFWTFAGFLFAALVLSFFTIWGSMWSAHNKSPDPSAFYLKLFSLFNLFNRD
ncbi:hypothetical protein DL95DRAFT_466230 [Leptodontidium sp. 2 PMI_412]|nr:hypothetical protein DL95DRAFT_466230 [Leptodontidium sp. 2 PMI_412]